MKLLHGFCRVLVMAVGICPVPSLIAGPTAGAVDTDNWPRFRGPGGGGVSTNGFLPPFTADGSGDPVLWKAMVPAVGFSSPVVWGTRVFLSGGDAVSREVLCFDTGTGRLLWHSAVPKTAGSPGDPVEVPDQSGMAASTVATDGLRVYALFANGDLAAFDFGGNPVWAKHLADPVNPYGLATSLLTWQDRVIVQFDQGDPDDHLSKLAAFASSTGSPLWEQPRPAGASWSTPITIDVGGETQIITLAVPWVMAYSATDGREIWRADCLDGEVTPSPVFAGGALFVVSPSIKLQMIRPGGRGDVTKTHLGWIAEDGIPDVTSPVSNGDLVFLVSSGGMVTCYDAKTGLKQWEQDLGEECSASPSIVGNRLCVITKGGTLVVLEADR
ncbi:MAG: PQQ-binding-like beta-propeller repeat protein, partial [Verrucomicrobiales bacterium]